MVGLPDSISRACVQTLQWQWESLCPQQHAAGASIVSNGSPEV
jgi:hypothetical protein